MDSQKSNGTALSPQQKAERYFHTKKKEYVLSDLNRYYLVEVALYDSVRDFDKLPKAIISRGFKKERRAAFYLLQLKRGHLKTRLKAGTVTLKMTDAEFFELTSPKAESVAQLPLGIS